MMKIKVIGKAHREGVSKKSGNPYNFNQVHYNGPDRGVKCRGCRYRPWCYLFRSRPPPPPRRLSERASGGDFCRIVENRSYKRGRFLCHSLVNGS